MEQNHQGDGHEAYKLGRDAVASVRLNLQHYYWRQSLGYNLHPMIPVDKPDLAIADVGTGTGIWLLELVSHLPTSTRLVGLDVSAEQFPNRYWIPENVQLVVDDASSGLAPEELRGVFDIVHVRLLMLMVTNNDPSTYIKYCLSLLKPGGYLQWEEYENYSSCVARASNKAKYEHLPKMLFNFATLDSFKWIPSLADHFLQNGLEVVSLAKYGVPGHHLKGFTDTLCVGQLELAHVFKASGDTEKAFAVREGLRKAVEEIAQGTYLRLSMQVTVGRKRESDNLGVWTSVPESLARHA